MPINEKPICKVTAQVYIGKNAAIKTSEKAIDEAQKRFNVFETLNRYQRVNYGASFLPQRSAK
jgi:hypothetical protein